MQAYLHYSVDYTKSYEVINLQRLIKKQLYIKALQELAKVSKS